jgi:predicted ribosomally synthesized peptide with SipW-like signal peptide
MKENKKAKKVVALLLCAVLLVVGSVTGTMAYLTSKDTVTNTFTVGNVAIKLDEAKVNAYGKPVNDSGNVVDLNDAPRVKTNDYKLIPGHKYVKDPTVTVTAKSEGSYVRMMVTVSDLADLKAACGVTGTLLLENYVDGWDNTKWISTSLVENSYNTAIYEFRYYTVVPYSESDTTLEPLFKHFTMPETATNAQITALEEMEINVVAHAIQADGFADAAAAWTAFTI